MTKVPMVDGVRIINRHKLYIFDAPLYVVATPTKNVVVYYDGDAIPEYLTQSAV